MAITAQLDITLINGYLEVLDHTVIQQMLALYSQQSAIYLAEIENAISLANQKLWQEQCHKMKGAAASTGLCQVHKKLVAIEKSEESWRLKSEYLQELRLLNQAGITVFTQWLVDQKAL